MTRRRKLPPTVLVTGGSRRLGAAICTTLSSAGYRIALHFNHSEKPALALCRTLSPGSFVVRGDLSTLAGCRSVFAQALEWAPRIDALVNNAALFLPDGHPAASLLRPVNYWAPRRLLRLLAAQRGTFPLACVHLLDARISSLPSPPFTLYTRSKLALSRTLRRDALLYAPRLRLNAIAPGPVLPPETLHEKAPPLPLTTRPTPADIASAVLFLLRTPSLTSQLLYLDSGQHLLSFASPKDGVVPNDAGTHNRASCFHPYPAR